MESSLYQKAEQFVVEAFDRIGKPGQIKHFIRTVYWLEVLSPQADEASRIAAVSHDIERAFRKSDMLEKKAAYGFINPEFYRPHEERGAEIMAEFLNSLQVESDLIEKVKHLIARHEEGGDDEQNLIKDADSVSFFENNVEHFLNNETSAVGRQEVLKKFSWMFNRITTDRAREYAQPFYKRAVAALKAMSD